MQDIQNYKVLILAGGYGSRLESLTKILPKPLVKIGADPIIIHLMRIFLNFNIKNFYFAIGYNKIEFFNFFRNYLNKSFLKKKKISFNYNLDKKKCNITLIDTGLKSMTGRRLKLASQYIKDDNFFLTYGDGLANINLKKLLDLHLKKKKFITLSAVNPPARFGKVIINKNRYVTKFSEKELLKSVWINGGFFVVNKKFLKLIKKNAILERKPLEEASKLKQLIA